MLRESTVESAAPMALHVAPLSFYTLGDYVHVPLRGWEQASDASRCEPRSGPALRILGILLQSYHFGLRVMSRLLWYARRRG